MRVRKAWVPVFVRWAIVGIAAAWLALFAFILYATRFCGTGTELACIRLYSFVGEYFRSASLAGAAAEIILFGVLLSISRTRGGLSPSSSTDSL